MGGGNFADIRLLTVAVAVCYMTAMGQNGEERI